MQGAVQNLPVNSQSLLVFQVGKTGRNEHCKNDFG